MASDLVVWAKQTAFQKMMKLHSKKQNMVITLPGGEAKP